MNSSLVLSKLCFHLQSSENENSRAARSGPVLSPHDILPENLCFQHSEFWGIQGKQQEGHGNSSEGTKGSVWRTASWEEPTTDLSLLQPLQILSRCDLCLIQEVRDSKGEAVPALVKHLNRSELVLQTRDPSVEISSQNIGALLAESTKRTHTHIWRVNGWDGRATRSNTSTFTGMYRCEPKFALNATLRSSSPQEQLVEGQRALSVSG